MDLASLASELGLQNNKAAKELLPRQQKTRSYQDEPNIQYSELIINLTQFQFGEERGWWKLKYKINYPLGSTSNQKASKAQLMAYAQDYLEANTDRSDLKYVVIEKVDDYNIIYKFDHITWFKANFQRKPHFKPPTSLYWKYTVAFPRIIYVNNYGKDLQKFIQTKFEDWIDTKKSYLKHKKFSFIEKMAAKLFNFKWDYSAQRMYAHLKYSVILGSLALYMSLYHNKDANKMDIKKIQRQAANFGDVKRLDKYIKKFN